MKETHEMSYENSALPARERARKLTALMTREEKVAQLTSVWAYEVMDGVNFSEAKAHTAMGSGIGQITRIGGSSNLEPMDSARLANRIQKYLREETRLGIPAMVHEEACSGYMARGATTFPQAIGIASTFDPESAGSMGEIIAKEMRSVGGHQALAPLLDITRDARWGRVEETFGEDPFLVAQLGMRFIRGLQEGEHAVLATGKHFVGYGVSEGGMNWAPAHIGERELREMYLFPFEAAVTAAGLGSVMPAYHEIDGIPCHASYQLLHQILRDEWKFKGLVVSDYFALAMLQDYHNVADTRKEAAALGLEAGVDVELPTRDCYGSPLVEAVAEGRISEDTLNEAVERVLEHKFQLGLFENPYVDESPLSVEFNSDSSRAVSLRLARESIILLKNEESILPLPKKGLKVLVVGPNAYSARNMMGDYSFLCHIDSLIEMREVGNVFDSPLPASLSHQDVFADVPTIAEAMSSMMEGEPLLTLLTDDDVNGPTHDEIKQAQDLAEMTQVAVVVVGDKAGLTLECTTGESRDRTDLSLPGRQSELVRAIADTGTPIVLVLVNGRPVTLGDLEPRVKAIVEAWLPGSQGPQAVSDVIFGEYNPGGKLPISVPRSGGQVPVFYNHKPSGGRSHWHGDYVDSLASPLYSFGHGLSYTEFTYSAFTVGLDELAGEATITCTVANTGMRAGDEVVQLYIHDVAASVTQPVKELKGFARVTIAPQRQRQVLFHLALDALAFYDKDYRLGVEPGWFDIMVGSSSDDIRREEHIEIHKPRTVTQKVFSTPVEIGEEMPWEADHE